jgi:uncharacterized cupin superfamily protein
LQKATEKEPEMILRAGSVKGQRFENLGTRTEERIGEASGLTKMGANIVTLNPGAMSARRHWHEQEDEFLYVIEGHAVVVENDGEHQIGPGDMCCWPAGVDNAHHLQNRTDAPVRYLVVGAGPDHDRVHYPDEGQLLHHAPPRWWVEDAEGNNVREGLTD